MPGHRPPLGQSCSTINYMYSPQIWGSLQANIQEVDFLGQQLAFPLHVAAILERNLSIIKIGPNKNGPLQILVRVAFGK